MTDGEEIVTMRTQDDQWDITRSVGATALAVAACRALETRRGDDRLVHDAFAQAFVDAAGTVPIPDDPWDDPAWAGQATYLGVRSRFFDQALDGAVRAGITQVVLLAAGLDSRGARMGWPSGVTVYEVDQPAVLEFKGRVLAEQGAAPSNVRVPVSVDLRHDWPAALRASGFAPSRPSVWLAEGLLPYLPAEAEKLLFERVQELSAPGSRIAVEHANSAFQRVVEDPRFQKLWQGLIGTDIRGLLYEEEREQDPVEWLTAHGWSVSTTTSAEAARGWGRPLQGEGLDALGEVQLVDAELAAR